MRDKKSGRSLSYELKEDEALREEEINLEGGFGNTNSIRLLGRNIDKERLRSPEICTKARRSGRNHHCVGGGFARSRCAALPPR